MQVIEVKKGQHISFGDLEDLILIGDDSRCQKGFDRFKHPIHSLHRQFHSGNYALSISHENGAGSNPTIIIRHENVDPNLLLQELADSVETPTDVLLNMRKSKSKGRPTNFLRPENWFMITNYAEDGTPIDRHYGSVIPDVCSICQEMGAEEKIEHLPMPFAEANVFHQIHEIHKNNGTDIGWRDPSGYYLSLFYFVNNLSWSMANAKIDFKISLIDRDVPVYKLELNGKWIGFAVSPEDLMLHGRKRGVLFEDPGGCFALVIQSADAHPVIDEGTSFVFPMKSLLYENEYRCYHRNGKCLDNDLYGSNGSGGFDFSRLPSNVFQDILLRLPWKEQVLCRRVSKRWVTMGNAALAVSTKVIELNSTTFQNMQANDLNRLLPIVADGLELLKLNYGHDQVNLSCVESIPVFWSLREINFGSRRMDYDQFYMLLDKTPCLKKLEAVIPWRIPSDLGASLKEYSSVEQLRLWSSVGITDPYLMTIADRFPNLTRVYVPVFEYITPSCLSAFAERYGPKLIDLRMNRAFVDNVGPWSRMGAFTGIAACTSLTFLSLARTKVVSDSFLRALATGCSNLETLDLSKTKMMTNNGLAALGALPKLINLDISFTVRNTLGFSAGVSAIAEKGHLEQLIVQGCMLSANCLKTVLRHCRNLKLLDIQEDGASDLTAADAEEIATLFGRFGRSPHLRIRVRGAEGMVWCLEPVAEVQKAIRDGNFPHRGRLLIDARSNQVGFLEREDDGVSTDPSVLLLGDHMVGFGGGLFATLDDDEEDEEEFEYPWPDDDSLEHDFMTEEDFDFEEAVEEILGFVD